MLGGALQGFGKPDHFYQLWLQFFHFTSVEDYNMVIISWCLKEGKHRLKQKAGQQE